jgi:Fe-S-cluster-containing hydrogenase component 2
MARLLARCEGGGVRLLTEKCLVCGLCLKACPYGAAFWDAEAHKPVICVYCGFCAPWCPHGVLALENGPRDAPG